MASEELLAAGVAIDALFAFIDSDKLKLVRRKTKPIYLINIKLLELENLLHCFPLLNILLCIPC